MPIHAASSLLPPLAHHLALPAAAPLAAAAAAAVRCAAGDAYAISHGLTVGVGIGDVVVGPSAIPLLPAPVPVVGGVDFGEAIVLPEASLPCAICRGCLGDYLDHREAYEAAAYADSADAAFAHARERQTAGGMHGSGWAASTVAIVVLSLLLCAALAALAAVTRLWAAAVTSRGAARAPRFGRLRSVVTSAKPHVVEMAPPPPPPPPMPPPPPGARPSMIGAGQPSATGRPFFNERL